MNYGKFYRANTNPLEREKSYKWCESLKDSLTVVPFFMLHDLLTGEWIVKRSNAKARRTFHYWLTIIWLTVGTVVWVVLRDVLWFVGLMSLYAIWISHLTGWAAETPVEGE